MTQLGLFPEEPKPSGPRWSAVLVDHRHGYGPNGHPIHKGQPSRRHIYGPDAGDGTRAGELRAARAYRRKSVLAYHIELEQNIYPQEEGHD